MNFKTVCKTNKKTLGITFVVLSLLCVLSFFQGNKPMMSYLSDTKDVSNNLSIGSNDISIVETFNPSTPSTGNTNTKQVAVRNIGKNPCYVRIRSDFSSSDFNAHFNYNGRSGYNNTDFELKSDGYYYYKKVLKPGKTTPNLFDSVTFGSFSTMDRYPSMKTKFDVICYAESISIIKKLDNHRTTFYPTHNEAWNAYHKNM